MNNPKEGLISQITFFAENDFDFLELTIEPPEAYHFNSVRIKEVKDILSTSNMGLLAHMPWHFHLAYPIDEIQTIYKKHFRYVVDCAARFDAQLITIHPEFLSRVDAKKSILNKMQATLDELKKYASEHGIRLNLENYSLTEYSVSELINIVEGLELDITFDIGHANMWLGIRGITEFITQFSKRITHIHVHDNFGDKDSHLPVGAGNIDWDKVITMLKSFYDSTFTFEVHSNHVDYLLVSRNYFCSLWRR